MKGTVQRIKLHLAKLGIFYVTMETALREGFSVTGDLIARMDPMKGIAGTARALRVRSRAFPSGCASRYLRKLAVTDCVTAQTGQTNLDARTQQTYSRLYLSVIINALLHMRTSVTEVTIAAMARMKKIALPPDVDPTRSAARFRESVYPLRGDAKV